MSPLRNAPGFNWGFNRDSRLRNFTPRDSAGVHNPGFRDWANDLKICYPKPRLMTENMEKYTEWFYETYQCQRKLLARTTNNPYMPLFQPYHKTLEAQNQNISALFMKEPVPFHPHRFGCSPLPIVTDFASDARNYRPRYNLRRDVVYGV